METNSEQPEKAFSPMDVTSSGIEIDENPVQFAKAEFGIIFKPLGIEANPEQPENAPVPMFVTPRGMSIDIKPEQSENAESPMLITLSGSLIDFNPVQPENALFAITLVSSGIMNTKLVAEENLFPHIESAMTRVSPVQLSKALPMLVTLSGIVIEVKPEQPRNA